MPAQFSFLGLNKSIRTPRVRRTPAHCQRVWQGILILATLALALAANAEGVLCYDVFAGLSAPLRSGNTVVIHYSFAQMDANGLSNPVLKQRLLVSAQREQKTIENQLAALKGASAKTIATRAELNSRLKAVSHIADLARAGGRLNQQQLSFVTTHPFELQFAINGKAGRELLQNTLTDLEGSVASIKKVDLPKNGLRRVLHIAGKHKVLTFIIVATVASSGGQAIYHMYTAPAPLNGKITAVYQDCGLDDKCSSSGESGVPVAQARAKASSMKAPQVMPDADSLTPETSNAATATAAGPSTAAAPQPQAAPAPQQALSDSAPIERAHDDPSLSIGN